MNFLVPALLLLASCGTNVCCHGDLLCNGKTEYYNPEVVRRCDTLTGELEQALLTRNNLYLLQEVFFPHFDIPPSHVYIDYKLHGVVKNESNATTFTFGWSSSSLYATFDPIIISSLNTGIFSVLKINKYRHVALELDIHNTSIAAADENDLKFILSELTTQVSIHITQNHFKSYSESLAIASLGTVNENPSLFCS